jgi:hypothetical protein
MAGLLLALVCAFVSGFFTLAALSYRHTDRSGEYRAHLVEHYGIQLLASDQHRTNWQHTFAAVAIIAGALALIFVCGVAGITFR